MKLHFDIQYKDPGRVDSRNMNRETKSIVISRINVATAQVEKKEDFVAKETALHIFLGAVHFVSVLCSPTMLREFVVGHLLGEGIVDSANEISHISFNQENRCHITLRKTGEVHTVVSKSFTRLIVTSCGSRGHMPLSELLEEIRLNPLPAWRIKAKVISNSVRQLNKLACTFKKTGGVHVAALFTRGGILVASAEDVGRHNAVDKVIGDASLREENIQNCFLTLSGRLTGDIVLKAARVGVPVVASLAAAVDSGVEVADKTGVTLVGFVRGKKMNAYTCPKRIVV